MLEKNIYRPKNQKDEYFNPSKYRNATNYTSVQQPFLGHCVREGTEVNVLLKNDGVKNGYIRGFDNWSLLISDKDESVSLVLNPALPPSLRLKNSTGRI